MFRRLLPLALLASLVSCSSSDSNSDPGSSPVNVEIRRTEYGIPHIKANDWTSLGYGFGYAYAQDNFCVVMREIVFAIGRSAELMGEEMGNVNSDFLFTYLNGDKEEFREEFFDALPSYAQELATGYARGLNRYLEETGVENLPEGDLGCRDAEWVFPVDEIDLLWFLRRISLQGSSDQGIFRTAIIATEGPSESKAKAPSPKAIEDARVGFRRFAEQLRNDELGSNALALGSDATQTGRGILLGNPHQPWFGAGAWYQAHLTLPGELDVAGAALHGFPFIGIGFNRDVAWTHTVSLANRFTLFELFLNPDDPMQYDYEGEWRDITSADVEIQVKLEDGSLETRTETIYESQYGPIVNLKNVTDLLDGWPIRLTGNSVLAFRDANLLTGIRGIEQWITKGQATNLDEYVDSLGIIGNPLFHDVAADRNGDAFYGEVSAVPFVTQAQMDACIEQPLGVLLGDLTTNVILSLDGSDAACEWGTDPDAPEGTNLYAPAELPQIRTADYVGNSNNSYWLSDANNPLEGFPTIMGPVGHEGLQQFLRTRIGHLMVAERKNATDELSDTPLFDLETLKGMMYKNRVYGAEIVLDDVATICATEAASTVQDACSVLGSWDRKVELDSRGAQVFIEFWNVIRDELVAGFQSVVESNQFWRIDYDPSDPLNTPAGIDTDVPANHERVIAALEEATSRLEAANVPLDAPWGEVQFLERNGEKVPIHGGAGTHGVYGAINVSLKDGGYANPSSGNSYIQAVTWDDSECPIADVILVPSQSTDPTSPHFADQTKLYSEKEWVRFPFCEEQIVAAQIGETLTLTE